jgi:hypothetical protein
VEYVTQALKMGTGTEIRARNSETKIGKALGQRQSSAATRQHAKYVEQKASSFTLTTSRNIANIQNFVGQ